MRLIVCGSRGWPGESWWVSDYLSMWEAEHRHLMTDPLVIVHGDCAGSPDGAAKLWASGCTDDVALHEAHPADWKRLGPRAGFERNREMAKLGAFGCVAFWDGFSRGTQHMILTAVQHGIKVEIVPATTNPGSVLIRI